MKVFTFQITETELQVLSTALGEIPYKFSAPVVAKLQQQINEQLKGDVCQSGVEKNEDQNVQT